MDFTPERIFAAAGGIGAAHIGPSMLGLPRSY